MRKNIGMFERLFRIWIGIMAILFALFSKDVTYAWLGWIGIIPLITGLAGWCGLYKLFGISTIKNDSSSS